MAELSYPTANGGSVTDANYELLMAPATGDGLIGKTSLAPLIYADSSGRQVKVRGSRGAIVRGFRWQSDAAGLTVTIDANTSGQTRVDLVVLRLDRASYTVRVAVRKGTASSQAVAPNPVYGEPPGQFFELPLAQVTVKSGTSVLGAGDVKETTWYLAEPAVVGNSGFAPPPQPGRLFMQTDSSNTLLVGKASGGYDTVVRDSGWMNIPLAAGWKINQGLRIRRKNDICFLDVSIQRSGAKVPATTDSVVATIGTSSLRPDIAVNSVFYCSNPDHAGDMYVSGAGQIVLNANGSQTINTDSYVWGQVMWPVSW